MASALRPLRGLEAPELGDTIRDSYVHRFVREEVESELVQAGFSMVEYRTEPYAHAVGIVGLGYVGLPLAVEFAEAGHDVVGIDVDQRRVTAVAAGGEINQAMPYFCAEKIAHALNDREKSVKGSRVVILGVSYKPGVGDMRESPSIKIMRLLSARGGELAYLDPFVAELPDFGLPSEPSPTCWRAPPPRSSRPTRGWTLRTWSGCRRSSSTSAGSRAASRRPT